MLNRKGITPIIAIVLLLMITVAVAGTVSFWLSSVQKGAQGEIEQSTEIITSQTQQAITISFIRCEESTNTISIVVKNAGTRPIEEGPVELTVSDQDGIENLAYGTTDSPWTTLEVDLTESVDFDGANLSPAFTLVDDTSYQLRIAVPGGATTSIVCTAA